MSIHVPAKRARGEEGASSRVRIGGMEGEGEEERERREAAEDDELSAALEQRHQKNDKLAELYEEFARNATEEQLTRFEAYRRAHFKRAPMSKLMKEVLGTSSANERCAIILVPAPPAPPLPPPLFAERLTTTHPRHPPRRRRSRRCSSATWSRAPSSRWPPAERAARCDRTTCAPRTTRRSAAAWCRAECPIASSGQQMLAPD